MADLLSQKEIDQLLDSSITGDETSKDVVEGVQEKVLVKTKTFSYKMDKNIRFPFPYYSPVIKKENIIFDPSPDVEDVENKVVVRSLKNYIEYSKNKRNQ
ncbi:MAG: hypothetical protein HWN67_19680 [Candidatus Helarchaeota archaeon]|nr:hypothetical protein [Candidatus Helarchaeota archaeon]